MSSISGPDWDVAVEIETIFERLGPGLHCSAPEAWGKGFGLRHYIQHNPVAVDLARVSLLTLIEETTPGLRGRRETGAWCTPEDEAHIHFAIVVGPLRTGWGRIRRFDTEGREWWSIPERLTAEFLSGTELSDLLMAQVHKRWDRIVKINAAYNPSVTLGGSP